MQKEIYTYCTNDHRRLEALLDRATATPGTYEMNAYGEFRAGLLKHIKIEETILLPFAQKTRGGEPLPIAARIRLDHGAITALMVPPPSPAIVAALRDILARHDALEEGPRGMYEALDALANNDVEELMKKIRAASDVPLHPHKTGQLITDATRRALERAGYKLSDYE
ncbi:MAG: hemerythrin domain-containing protein [Bacteroidota bacterium]|nr:hemerythrin domain-containing protein [Bacteroidota bacterium]